MAGLSISSVSITAGQITLASNKVPRPYVGNRRGDKRMC